jgi:antibiotic biosynthesis monooxygenase (ABM) superfamily enzyme
MTTPRQFAEGQSESVAFVITHKVREGQEPRYEAWLGEILGAVSAAPGYLGREVFRPPRRTTNYTTILRFGSKAALDAWAESDARRAFVDRVRDLLEHGDVHEIQTGIDFWFTPEGVKAPKPWKQFLLILSAVYPLSLIIPVVFGPLFVAAPALGHPLVRGLLIAGTLAALLTFVILPRYTRLVKLWLYEESG